MRSRTRRPWRRVRLTVLVAACGALLVTAALAVRQVARTAQSEVDSVLAQAAHTQAAQIAANFRETARLDLLLSRNPQLRAASPNRAAIAAALADVQSLGDGDVVAASLLGADGRVYVQVVDGVPVDDGMLVRRFPDLARVSPTLKLAVGVVSHSVPYRSRGNDRWVIATTTTIVPTGGGPPRIVVIETDLATMRTFLRGADGRVMTRLVGPGGAVIANSRISPVDAAPIGPDADVAVLKTIGSVPGRVNADGQSFVFEPVQGSPANANRWSVVASMPSAGGGSTLRAGGSATAMALASLLLLVFGVLALRRHRDTLSIANITDPLTGLLNRGALARRGEEVLERGRRDGRMTAVATLNLHRFRDINDALGHAAGDEVLVEVSRRLRAAIRTGDLLVRLGGDEFAILLTQVEDRIGAEEAAAALLATLHPAIRSGVHSVGVHAIMGVALAPDDGARIDELIERAGAAMYAARREGGTLRFFDGSITSLRADHLSLVADLRAAMESDQLRLHYQPKVSLHNGRVEGVEAFIRWHHPRLGLLSPAVFVPLAEETGLIDLITRKAITLALAQTRAWLDEGLQLQVAVNLSGRCVQDEATVEVVARGLTRWQVPPHLLKLEISETEIVTHPDRARAVLDQLHALGVGLSMDDYGTGYSSLMSLRSLPVREIKIDRMFLEQMKHAQKDQDIVRSTIELGHSLGLSVVAEGVEDRDAVRALVGLGCDTAQGNFFCAPMPAEELRTWLLERNGALPKHRPRPRPRTPR